VAGTEGIMVPKISDIICVLNDIAPPSLAEEWDNIGLQLGDPTGSVKKIWTALDPTIHVVKAACAQDIDMLITHHPLIFKPIKTIDFQTPLGAIIDLACRHHLAIFSAHTNLDSAWGGLNDIFAHRIGLQDLKPLAAGAESKQFDCDNDPLVSKPDRPGIGRVGHLEHRTDLKSLALSIKKIMDLKFIQYSGDPDLSIKTVAICTGSGSGLLSHFLASGAQVYISGDMRYHDARDVEAAKLGIIDIGHFSSEHFIVNDLAERLKTIVAESSLNITIEACDLEKDPFEVL
jgi:dinuclear metal center YbgI/SA1388 family protein